MRRATSLPPELPGYTFVRTLGSGGFSDVFLYEQQLPRRRVAVKVLLTGQVDPSTRARFVDEANLMAQLSTHPFIVTIYHAGVAGDGRPYFAMEYCSGPSLAERYKRERFTVEDALRTGVRLAGAIATAHAAGILHRDIKPANVLTNDFGWPALTDFGISSTLEDELPVNTGTGPASTGASLVDAGAEESQAIGMSVPWSPPEMFEDDPKPDVRSDVFSLAATIHTLLAGRTPFEIPGRSNGALDLIGRIERGVITPMSRDDVPASLVAVLRKGMATDRRNRYPSALDFARALQRIELEIGYAATGIDVPKLVTPGRDRRDAPAGEDETRARAVVTIAAQPSAAEPTPLNAAETRLRRPVVIDPGTRTAPAAPAAGAGGRPIEATVLRPGRSATRVVTAPPPPGDDRMPVEPSRRRRGLVAAISVVSVLVVAAAVVAAVTLSGSEAPVLAPSSTPIGLDPGAANPVVGVPAPSLEKTETSVDGTAVTFTLGDPDPKPGDLFRWARADEPNRPQLSTSNAITVDDVTPGARVCLDLYLQRADGKLSEANRVCSP
jgi:eukaryotic-like serine/threonine-protein kinase